MLLFSIVIPTYQSGNLLRRTLKSLNQIIGYNRDEVEVIVIDDGSTDGTGKMVQELYIQFQLKYLYLERSSEACRAQIRNRGWQETAGKYIVFIDSDMILSPNHLIELDRIFSYNPDSLVFGTKEDVSRHVSETESIFQSSNIYERLYNSIDHIIQHDARELMFYQVSFGMNYYLYPWFYLYSCNISISRKWLEKTGGFSEDYKGWGLEDVDFGLRYHHAGIRLIYSHKLTAINQWQKGNTWSGFSPKRIEEYQKNLDLFLKKHSHKVTLPLNIFREYLQANIWLRNDKVNTIASEEVVLTLRNGDSPEELKKKVLLLMEQNQKRIVILDYYENSDLDLWIQNLDDKKMPPQYFPMSALNHIKKTILNIKNIPFLVEYEVFRKFITNMNASRLNMKSNFIIDNIK